jgi:soluble lytic murein transglycosylase-like protein
VRNRLAVLVFTAVALAAPLSASAAPHQTQALPQLAATSFPLPVPQYLSSIINEASAKYRVDPNLIAAMAFRESRFDANAVSRRGAQGIMQLMPRTAQAMGVRNAFDPRDNVFGATRYLATLLNRFHGNVDLTLAAYNAGPELVDRVGPNATQEAVDYVAAVKSFYLTALRALS